MEFFPCDRQTKVVGCGGLASCHLPAHPRTWGGPCPDLLLLLGTGAGAGEAGLPPCHSQPREQRPAEVWLALNDTLSDAVVSSCSWF